MRGWYNACVARKVGGVMLRKGSKVCWVVEAAAGKEVPGAVRIQGAGVMLLDRDSCEAGVLAGLQRCCRRC
jgi:hypothetical protein